MTEREKQLLLKYLCAILPYDVNAKGNYDVFDDNGNVVKMEATGTVVWVSKEYATIGFEGIYYSINCRIDTVKPYLRPISCMTEEEVDTLFNVLKIDEKRGDWLKVNDIGIIRLFTEAGKDFYEIAAAFDYLNSIRVDYRGLIEKGLALEAPEGMYKIVSTRV